MSPSSQSASMVPKIARVALALLLPLGVIGAVWFVQTWRSGDRAHDAAVALWESKEPSTYSFDYSECSGMCGPCSLHVTVVEGEVTAAVTSDQGCRTDDAPTIEDVFASEEAERSAEMTDSFEIHYDPTWGFPASVEIRCPDDYTDCGSSYSVTNFLAGP